MLKQVRRLRYILGFVDEPDFIGRLNTYLFR